MPRWISPFSVLIATLLSCGGFAAVRNGWLPVELGGAQTGSIVDTDSSTPNIEPSPEFEADDTPAAMPREPLDTKASTPVSARPSQWDTLLAEEAASEAGLVQTAVFQKSTRRSSSGLRLVSEEQPVTTAQKPESTTDLPPAESEPTTEPAVRVAKRSKEQEAAFDFTNIDRQIKAGQIVDAHKALSKLYWQQPDVRSQVQERIDLTAKALYFSPQPHIQEPYIVQAGDQLRKIASKHHVPWPYLARLNRTDPKRLREGQKLKVINGPFGAVVTLSDFELTLHLGGQYVRSYPCCIGKNNSTPTGKFKVLNKVTSPQYTDPDGKVFSGTDPQNPLGTHWLDLGDSYGIHGTIEPDSIGKAESRGCIRLLNADVSEVYDLLETGSEVVIRQ